MSETPNPLSVQAETESLYLALTEEFEETVQTEILPLVLTQKLDETLQIASLTLAPAQAVREVLQTVASQNTEIHELYKTLFDTLALTQALQAVTPQFRKLLHIASLTLAPAQEVQETLQAVASRDILDIGTKIQKTVQEIFLHILALGQSDQKNLQVLLAQSRVNTGNNRGGTPLGLAAWGGYEKIVEILVDAGAEVNIQDRLGRTPLHSAALRGHVEVVKILLATGKVDLELKDFGGRTALSWAAGEGHLAVVQELLATGIVDVDTKDGADRTPLMFAAAHGKSEMVEELIATGLADVNAKDRKGRTPLMHAAKKGHVTTVKALLTISRVDIDAKELRGRTALSRAAARGHTGVVELLLDNGQVDVNAAGTFKYDDHEEALTPYMVAVKNGHTATAEVLFKHGGRAIEGGTGEMVDCEIPSYSQE
jgi:ankyrin repeat protein